MTYPSMQYYALRRNEKEMSWQRGRAKQHTLMQSPYNQPAATTLTHVHSHNTTRMQSICMGLLECTLWMGLLADTLTYPH